MTSSPDTTQKTPVQVWPGADAIRSSIPSGWHTSGKAGELIGRSRDTIKRWRGDGTYLPSGYMMMGRSQVWLYSDEDIDNMRDIAGTKKAGRPKRQEEDD